MKTVRKTLLLFLLFPVFGSAQGPWPDTPTGIVQSRFIEAFNTGDTTVMQAFVRDHYAPGRSGTSAYWSAVFRETGPLAFVGTQTERIGNRTNEIFWYRGTVTRVVIGIILRHEDQRPYRITRNSVLRGVRPPFLEVPPAIDPGELADSLQPYLIRSAEAGHFSGVVLVARNGRVLFEGAAGYADRERGIPNTLDTRFALASVTKMFTGVAIAQLAERGHLNYDDPIERFIPEYPSHIGSQVTVRHLLTHSSGIEIDNDPDFNRDVTFANNVEDLLAVQLQYIERLNLGNYDNFEPLGTFDYTNEGIDLLGVIVERVSGMPWEEYLEREIFRPAGMTSTRARLPGNGGDLARGYTSRGPGERGWLAGPRRPTEPHADVGSIRPAGSGVSTARDMWMFLRALQAHELVGAPVYQTIISPQIEVPVPPELGFTRSYGFTFDIMTGASGLSSVGHTGGAPGMGTVVQFYPQAGYTVIVLSNFDRAAAPVNQYIKGLLGIV